VTARSIPPRPSPGTLAADVAATSFQPGPRPLRGALAQVVRNPTLLVWSLFLFSMPFYVFPSGLPQPGDILVLLLVPMSLARWKGRLNRPAARVLRTLLLLTTWILIVDWGWALWEGNFGLVGRNTFLLFPIYYVFNTLVFLVACVLYQRYGARFLWLTLTVVFVTVLFQVAASFVVHRGYGIRRVIFFNNPNQLGFYALMSASILALGQRKVSFGTLRVGIGLTACLYLALLSASRAAVGGIGILFALTILANPKRILVVSLGVLGLMSVGGPVARAIDGTEKRIESDRHPHMNFLEERAYDRILANKQYWLLGAGEGGTERFASTTMIGATEIHSSIGTVFFCSGFVGLSLFVAFLLRVARGAPLRSQLMLLPMLAYTFAHQGLRAQLLWVMLATFVAVKDLRRSAPSKPATREASALRPDALTA